MLKAVNTRRVTNLRHYNDQNPNVNPARTRATAPQMVREAPYFGVVRTVIIRPTVTKEVNVSGREVNGVPMPVVQKVRSKGGAIYE